MGMRLEPPSNHALTVITPSRSTPDSTALRLFFAVVIWGARDLPSPPSTRWLAGRFRRSLAEPHVRHGEVTRLIHDHERQRVARDAVGRVRGRNASQFA